MPSMVSMLVRHDVFLERKFGVASGTGMAVRTQITNFLLKGPVTPSSG